MRHRRPRKRKTDYGTIILHWLLVGPLAVAIITGLQIAAEAPDRTWINSIDDLLPMSMVWTGHIQAAVALAAVAVAYATYLPLAGLVRRIRIDCVRLRGLLGRRQQRWGAINVILYWGFYTTLLVQLMTGGLLYFSLASAFLVAVHWYGMWVILGYAGLHVMSNWALGGSQQLLRIVRPALLAPRTPPFDPMEVFALLDEAAKSSKPAETVRRAQSAAREPGVGRPLKWRDASSAQRDQAPRRPPGRYAEAAARDHTPPRPRAPRYADGPSPQDFPELEPRRPQRPRGPVLQANPFMVATAVALVGVTVPVTIDRQMVDTIKVRRITRSEVPLLNGDESDAVWQTVHPFYLLTEQGGNFFAGSGETMVEIRAVNDGECAYRGGFERDPGTVNFSDNFDPQPVGGYRYPIIARRLPKDYKAMSAAMGQIDLDPDHGESDGARWYMTTAESVAYSPEPDAQIPVGTIIPGVIIAGEYAGDRADVRCAARWTAGRWALETTRLLDTKGKYDT